MTLWVFLVFICLNRLESAVSTGKGVFSSGSINSKHKPTAVTARTTCVPGLPITAFLQCGFGDPHVDHHHPGLVQPNTVKDNFRPNCYYELPWRENTLSKGRSSKRKTLRIPNTAKALSIILDIISNFEYVHWNMVVFLWRIHNGEVPFWTFVLTNLFSSLKFY